MRKLSKKGTRVAAMLQHTTATTKYAKSMPRTCVDVTKIEREPSVT
jgi:hypothetical protein